MQITNHIRLWLFGLLLLTASGLRAAEEEEALCVILDDGTELIFTFDKNPEVTFDDENVYIQTTSSSATYLVESVQEFRFVEAPVVTNVEEGLPASSAKIHFRIMANDWVKVTGVGLTPEVSVYTAEGKSVDVPVDYSQSEINIRLGSLPRGLYIIKTNQQSFKFIRK